MFPSGFCNGERIGVLMKCVVIWENWQFSGYFRWIVLFFYYSYNSNVKVSCCLLRGHIYLTILLIQAVWVWTVSLPVTVVNASNHNPPLRAADVIGWIMWLVGVVTEATADQQKLAFKNSPENRGKWCNVGLWKVSRHPNYFGEVRPLLKVHVFL